MPHGGVCSAAGTGCGVQGCTRGGYTPCLHALGLPSSDMQYMTSSSDYVLGLSQVLNMTSSSDYVLGLRHILIRY